MLTDRAGLITDNGKVTDEGTETFLRRYLEAFYTHVSTFKRSHTWT